MKAKMRIQQNAEWCLHGFIPARREQRIGITVNFVALAWYSKFWQMGLIRKGEATPKAASVNELKQMENPHAG